MRGLEEALIRTLGEYGLEAGRIPGLTGVWALPPPRAGGALPRVHHKLAAIGVAVQGGVTYHGFALNVAPDLSHFGYIVPCGIADRPVGSLELLLAPQPPPSMEAARTLAVRHLRSVFGYGD
jgi:lipoyl(octanoyl) transferase